MSVYKARIGAVMTIGALLLAPCGIGAADDAAPAPGTYRIVEGKADWGTYAGWFTYHLSCHMCHGMDAVGTDVAPDLRASLKTMSAGQFAATVLARYRLVEPAGPDADAPAGDSAIGEVLQQRRGDRGRVVMPVWPADPGMRPHILDLYAYLKARSDNAIGPGRPATSEP